MTGWTDIKGWFHKTFPAIPEDLLDDYQVDTQGENAKRVKIIGGIFIVLSIVLLCLTATLSVDHDSHYNKIFVIVNVGLFLFSGTVFILGHYIRRGTWDITAGVSRAFVLLAALGFVLWASWMTYTNPFGLIRDGFYLAGVFLVYSILLLSLSEIIVLSSLIIIGQFLLPQVKVDVIFVPDGFQTLSLAILVIAGVLSRVLYYARIRNYLNWENINGMNLTLKREVVMHMSTTEELEQIRLELDKKVHRQTKHLREANQRLSEEIAERRYADKVRGILYRISTFVNRHQEIPEVFEYIHTQLSSIMEVGNFYIGQFIEHDYTIRTVFEVGDSEFEVEDSNLRSISNYMIRQKRPLLLDRKKVQALAKSGEIELPSMPTHCWLGVPLMVDNSIVGVLVVKSYSSSLEFDQTDLELLEYVSEHLALAMARKHSEEKLIGAKERAEESDRLKSAFLANLSHEIRTPMNAIVGFAELIGSSDLNEKERSYYSDQVVDNSNYLLKLISNIIELSKIQSGQILLRPVENSVSKSLQSLMAGFDDLKRGLNKQNLTIDLEIDSEVRDQKFSADSERFMQVMNCLVENGLKFTHQGGVHICVQAFDHKRLQFSVQDTGIGMDEDETKKIFEWFRQGAKASQDLYRGMGLGLTLTKLLIDVMGGRIWVETELGSGSCFLFTLPLVKEIPTYGLNLDKAKGSPAQIENANQASAG